MKAETDPRRLGTFLKSIVLSGDNAQKIKGFSVRLNWAMNVFQVRWLSPRALTPIDIRVKLGGETDRGFYSFATSGSRHEIDALRCAGGSRAGIGDESEGGRPARTICEPLCFHDS